MLASCTPGEDAAAPRGVDPADYTAFFLWAGVRAPTELESAETVYLLSGEVRADDPGRIVPLRPHAPRAAKPKLWLVLRVERLDWDEQVYDQALRELARWQAAGNRLEGLQIDFDAETMGLEGYAAFLEGLRARLPERYKLSVTGLMDWSANGDPAALARLGGVLDEVVIQTYQGTTTIPGYQDYMARLSRLDMPYRIALVENGEWQEPASLTDDPDFQGYVVFLLADRFKP